MKRIFISFLIMAMLCLVGCQYAMYPDQNTGTNMDGFQGLSEPNIEEAITTIPIMHCNLETKNISVGDWDLTTNAVSTGDTLAGTTSDPYSLCSLHWDGDKMIAGLRVYLEELNKFNDSFDLRPTALEEVAKDEVSITLSDNGELILRYGDKADSISGAEVSIGGMGEVPPAMMQGNALAVAGNTVFYLQSVMGELGLYLVCTIINTETMFAENYVVGDEPFSYREVDIDAFGPSLFSEEDNIFYFCLTDAVYSFDPISRTLSQLFTLESLGLSNEADDPRVQFSGVTVYERCLIIESTEYKEDMHTQKTAYLCSLDGAVLNCISWDCQKDLIIFPES